MSDIAKRLREGGNDICRDGPMWPGDDMLEAADELSRLNTLVEHLKADRIRISEEAEAEIARLKVERDAAKATGRLEGLGQAERAIVSSINGMKAEIDEAGGKASPADDAFIAGQEDALSAILALREKQP